MYGQSLYYEIGEPQEIWTNLVKKKLVKKDTLVKNIIL